VPPFVHELGLCESEDVGDGTRIWAFAHVLPGASVGQDCNICDHVFIENDVVIGDRVTVKSGVQLWDGVRIGHDVFIGPNATLTNDPFPRSKQYQESIPPLWIDDGASLGANCTVLPGRRIGRNAMVGAGAVVTKDVPANAIVVGNPARIVGYVGGRSLATTARLSARSQPVVDVTGVSLIRLTHAGDLRGSLVALEHGELPFRPQRTFLVYDVPTTDVRGEHAHRRCEQLLVCVHGSVACVVDDGSRRQEVVLDTPTSALYVPPMTWGTQYRYSPDAVLLVLASHPYDASDYIRDYGLFLVESPSAKSEQRSTNR
jgi:UDP-2-acetamido-3-amino-2,3-dideoxy-glucuronate N-acetyltransferase